MFNDKNNLNCMEMFNDKMYDKVWHLVKLFH